MSWHSNDPALVALAWHDVTCPEAEGCRSRPLHAASAPLANGGVLARFMERLHVLDREMEPGDGHGCKEEVTSPYPDDYSCLPCQLSAGHEGGHENQETGYRWDRDEHDYCAPANSTMPHGQAAEATAAALRSAR